MKKILLFLFLNVAVLPAGWSQTTNEKSIDEQINEFVAPVTQAVSDIIFFSLKITNDISIPLILIWLFAGALFFTIYLKFINIRGFRRSLNVVRGKYSDASDPGEVSHFQALATALSGTVGLGNIAGVAIAISLGGPGATFWMILAGFLGMSSKFVECTLAVKYRKVHKDGAVSGGPMYYLKRGFAERGLKKTGAFLAAFFAIMCVGGSFGGGNMFQVNQAVNQALSLPFLQNSFIAGNAWLIGLGIALLVGLTIIGGIKSIARVTEKIVPFMCAIYALAAFFVIGSNISQLPEAFARIFSGAFSGEAVAGGVVGAMIQGIRRALFSNEAGMGSAAIAHSAVKTNNPVTEGFVANLEPFIDTVLVCTMTAVVIIITGAYENPAVDGIQITSAAFATVISWFPYVLSVVVILFAFSTMISWSYYGLKSWTFLFGKNKAAEMSYKFIFCGVIVAGASMQLGSVVDFSDAMIFAMSVPNMIGLYLMAGVVRNDINSFLQSIKSNRNDKDNKKDPVTYA